MMSLSREEESAPVDESARRATLSFLLAAASHDLFPGRTLFIEHSLADGYYCHFGKGDRATPEDADRLSRKMIDYLESDVPIILDDVPGKRLMEKFSREDREDKLAILERWQVDPVPACRFGDFLDYRFEPMTDDKGGLGPFELRPYDAGFVLRFPVSGPSGKPAPFVDAPRLYGIIQENERWGRILGVSTIGDLNRLCATGEIREMIWVAEGLHEKKIARIADRLCEGFPEKRVVFVAGPSASGKTTFARRLGIQLKVNGFSTRPVSMDDYFLDREKIPVDERGVKELETIRALDVDLLSDHVRRLLKGKAIPDRRFDFASGRAYETGQSIRLPGDTFIILEGIHGLNPLFAERIGKGRVQRIYVSAITQLNVDREHRVSTSDNRLLRRVVRDRKFRGYSAAETLSQWPAVRKGEDGNIFPFQEDADFMFNSSLVYEIPVLAADASALLREIGKDHETYEKARQLLLFLSFFVEIPVQPVPETSILREFVGDSAFVERP
ncbi:MAG: uridine kinase [Fidelibacterota bacterium]